MFAGVDHVGIGVGDMDAGARVLRARRLLATCCSTTAGEIPGTERFTGDGPRRARIAMLANPAATPVGPGRIKLVQVLDGDGPPPVPAGQAWGEVGVCELCLHVRDVQAVARAARRRGRRDAR